MSFFDLLVLALATWRISYLIVYEDAPWRLMSRLREWNDLGGLLRCIYCTSLWVAVGCWLLMQVAPAVVYVLAVSGGAMMLWRYTGGEHV